MPALTVKNIPKNSMKKLKLVADSHHRSLNSEILHCLETVLLRRKSVPRNISVSPGRLDRRYRWMRSGARDYAGHWRGAPMIVVDTNIIAYLYLPTDLTGQAERLLESDPSGLSRSSGAASFAMSWRYTSARGLFP